MALHNYDNGDEKEDGIRSNFGGYLKFKRVKFDDVDILILRTLAEDGRTPLRELSKKTKLAISTIHSRISRLIAEDVIEKFTIIVNPERLNYITAFVLLNVSTSKIENILSDLVKRDNVLEAYESLGKFNVVLKVRVKTLNALRRFINELSKLDGVAEFECFVTTKRYKEDTWKPEVES